MDLVARIGTAVTLVAMMVVIGSAFALLDDTPAPSGTATTAR